MLTVFKIKASNANEAECRGKLLQIVHRSFENVTKFEYLETTLTNQTVLREEITSKLNYHSVLNLFFSCLLLKNLKIKIYETNFSNINILIITLYIYKQSHATTYLLASVPSSQHDMFRPHMAILRCFLATTFTLHML
jgi:hypothetical protein